jgi:hypothetical protein
MTQPRFHTTLAAGLSLSLALFTIIPLSAQTGPGLSSGSGEGTGTGRSAGIQRNPAGSFSGVRAGLRQQRGPAEHRAAVVTAPHEPGGAARAGGHHNVPR